MDNVDDDLIFGMKQSVCGAPHGSRLLPNTLKRQHWRRTVENNGGQKAWAETGKLREGIVPSRTNILHIGSF